MAKKNQLTTSDHLEYSEYERLLECLRTDKEYLWEMYARLSFCTACRASDVLQFKWQDVLNKTKCVVTEKKTSKTRAIPFNDSVRRKIRELYKLMGSPSIEGYIFGSPITNNPITIQLVNRKLKYFKHRYGLKIENFSTHTFRKTFGRYVYDKSNHSAESLLLLNSILNHSNIQTTKVYIGITKEEVNSLFNSISF